MLTIELVSLVHKIKKGLSKHINGTNSTTNILIYDKKQCKLDQHNVKLLELYKERIEI